MKNHKKSLRKFIPVLIIIIFVCVGYITMMLWNALLPDIFHLPAITFQQALGLLVLSRLIFGFGHISPFHNNPDRRWLRDKWSRLTPEEREKLKQHPFFSSFTGKSDADAADAAEQNK